jgi:hypothetical protein
VGRCCWRADAHGCLLVFVGVAGMATGQDGGGMMVSMSSQSLSDMMQRDGDVLSRNMSRDNLMHDTLLRNASDTSLTDMVRNYSSASLEAVMEHGQHDVAGAWPAPSPASDASRSAHKVLACVCVWMLVLACLHPPCALEGIVPPRAWMSRGALPRAAGRGCSHPRCIALSLCGVLDARANM